ncbi:hypothetical protein BVY04_04660 [bacterium M21]|nr:hypothetical protein BVY04_04660 [bacterium M21]
MASTYKTPGVYVNEISAFPPSVAAVPTAIPAFLGFTEIAKDLPRNGASPTVRKTTKISSLLEYEATFGCGAEVKDVSVTFNEDNSINEINLGAKSFYLYDSIRMFYLNGGGDCYIASVGTYGEFDAIDDKFSAFKTALDSLEKEQEPTLILFPDAVVLDGDLYSLQQAALAQCAKLQNRFVIMDLLESGEGVTCSEDGQEKFRDNIGMNNLKWGAAYTPYLQTNLAKDISYASLSDETRKALDDLVPASNTALKDTIAGLQSAMGLTEQLKTAVAAYLETAESANLDEVLLKAANPEDATDATTYAAAVTGLGDVVAALEEGTATSELKPVTVAVGALRKSFDADSAALEGQDVKQVKGVFRQLASQVTGVVAAAQSCVDTADQSYLMQSVDYAKLVKEVSNSLDTLPPSGTIAGVYSATDSSRGVWKAPANVSLNNVVGLTENITSDIQESLNIDVVAGKSINAIRTFPGKGVLVWGARTLAGNDNDWRYINVRRFLIMAEESIRLSTAWAVFEPNDANLWVKLKAMIENFLIQQWKDGALAGSTPAEAFDVTCGLGTTMTGQDILEGYLRVTVRVAVVRPAEFIVLSFMQKMQES